MLIHLVKLSSAWMCSYSSLTAFPLSVVLWWASYTFNTTAGQQEQSHRVKSDSQSNFKGKPYFTSSYHCRKTSCSQGKCFFFLPFITSHLTFEFIANLQSAKHLWVNSFIFKSVESPLDTVNSYCNQSEHAACSTATCFCRRCRFINMCTGCCIYSDVGSNEVQKLCYCT